MIHVQDHGPWTILKVEEVNNAAYDIDEGLQNRTQMTTRHQDKITTIRECSRTISRNRNVKNL